VNVTQIEETVKKLASDVICNSIDKDQFIYELMAAYGHRRTTVSRIKSGERNLAKVAGEVRAKRHIYFKHSDSNKVFSDIDDMKKEPSITREKIRFVIATDFSQFVAVDTRTYDTLDIEFSELGKHFDFFLPWAGMEKAVYQGDNPADVKAAEKMAKLFDLIKADNFSEENKNDTAALHSLNVFLTRLLFCFFAEDTGIFKDNQFSAELESHTKADGSDVDSYLNRLFEVLNTSKENRHDLPDYLAKFEYVNGGLFADAIDSPKFSTKSRRMLIECGSELDWSGINPDIFGSMIQAVVHPDQRGGMGMHYTSVINIMKVIGPLFLDDLYADLENITENIDPKLKPSRLRKLHDRIANIKVFDPACGSGNFLIIAFKELRKLEMEIIRLLQEIETSNDQDDIFDEVNLNSSFSRIKLSQFYGIELDDFAHEVAILSLWLAEHQMNIEFKAEFGDCAPTLPLQNSCNVVCGNGTRMSWHDVCSTENNSEIFVIGNPPYLGFKMQNSEHKLDIAHVFKETKNYKKLDYISCWWYLAAKYIKGRKAKAAFVSTNSVCQGEHIGLLWPLILSQEVEIGFAYKSFKWKNNAKGNAGVMCIVLGIQNKNTQPKYIFEGDVVRKISNITPYLNSGESIVVNKSNSPISDFPKMFLGNMPKDDGNFILSKEEKDTLIHEVPEVEKFIRKLVGAREFIRGTERWCIWIEDQNLEKALQIPEIVRIIQKVKKFRSESTDKSANKMALTAHKFREQHVAENYSVIIPTVTSERRDYIPLGILDANTVIVAPNNVLYDPPLDVVAVIFSRMHMTWVKAVAGRLKTDYRYSSVLCYNTFPFPRISEEIKGKLIELLLEIFAIQESLVGKTIAELYDPLKMPKHLLQAHRNLDEAVDKCYQVETFKDDDERLEYLYSMYTNMTGNKNA